MPYTGMSYETFAADPRNRNTPENMLRAAYEAHKMRRTGNAGMAGGADTSGIRAYSAAHPGMGTGDFGTFDDATLQSWKNSAWDVNCPPDAPFQAFDGSGCVSKPIDSNYATGDARSIHNVLAGGGGGLQATAQNAMGMAQQQPMAQPGPMGVQMPQPPQFQAPAPQAPITSLLAGMQQPAAGAGAAPGGSGLLQNLMSKQQRPTRRGSWFGGGL